MISYCDIYHREIEVVARRAGRKLAQKFAGGIQAIDLRVHGFFMRFARKTGVKKEKQPWRTNAASRGVSLKWFV